MCQPIEKMDWFYSFALTDKNFEDYWQTTRSFTNHGLSNNTTLRWSLISLAQSIFGNRSRKTKL